MKLAAISMIRDEADIVASFLRHLDAMFDIVILLDQRSSDGSTVVMKAACGQRADWRYYLCDFAGRHQKEMINFIMPKAFEMGADALFVLEFRRVHCAGNKGRIATACARHAEQCGRRPFFLASLRPCSL